MYEDIRDEILNKDFNLGDKQTLENEFLTFERFMTDVLGSMIKYRKDQFGDFNFKCFRITEFDNDSLKLFYQDIDQMGLNKPLEGVEYIKKDKMKEEPYERYQKFSTEKVESLVQFTNRLEYMIPFNISSYSDIILDMWGDRRTLMDIYMTIIEMESKKWEIEIDQTYYYKEV
jgi:hypothetical protein